MMFWLVLALCFAVTLAPLAWHLWQLKSLKKTEHAAAAKELDASPPAKAGDVREMFALIASTPNVDDFYSWGGRNE